MMHVKKKYPINVHDACQKKYPVNVHDACQNILIEYVPGYNFACPLHNT